jgi:hypothetical protein
VIPGAGENPILLPIASDEAAEAAEHATQVPLHILAIAPSRRVDAIREP